MKRNPDLILRRIADEIILVPTGEMAQKFNGMITLNPVAALIWENLEDINNEGEMVNIVLDAFEIDEETAIKDVHGFIHMLVTRGFIEKE